jgi:hypothetical protein
MGRYGLIDFRKKMTVNQDNIYWVAARISNSWAFTLKIMS